MSLTVKIRTAEEEKKMNPTLRDSLCQLLKAPEKNIPLVYQYLHNPKEEVKVTLDNRIGVVTNFKRDKDGDITGDVTITNILRLALNFEGVIDNLVASFHPATNRAEIDAFIIYDKIAKDAIRKKHDAQRKSMESLAKAGEIPIMSSNGIDTMKEVTEKLLKEYENLVAEQDSKTKKEAE